MTAAHLESVEDFRRRARSWIETNLPLADDERVDDRALQNALFDAGFAGIAFPVEYGGAGLSFEHQKAFFDAAQDRQTPQTYEVSIATMGATLLDCGSEPLKQRHLPVILRGDERWIQLLSEPSGGSDMAGVLTRLTRQGDRYLLNGSKMWSTRANIADYGMCLARSDWNAPKYQGLSMIAVPLKNVSGLTIDPIVPVTGGPVEFFTEFFDDIALPAQNMIGEEGGGWAVAQALLVHERNSAGGIAHGIGLTKNVEEVGSAGFGHVLDGARARQLWGDPALRQRMAECYVEATVARHAGHRIMSGLRSGALKGQWGSLLKLHLGMNSPRTAKAALATWGPDGVIWDGEQRITGSAGEEFLTSRIIAIAAGTNEMQRNIISERLLGLPREPAADLNLPFNEVLAKRQRS